MSSDTADEEPLDHRSGFYVGWRPEPREGPPRNVRPTALNIDVDLAQTNDVLIRVGSFEVFPEGFTFALSVNIRLSELHRLADFVCYPFHTKVFRPDHDMTVGLIWPNGRAIDSWHTGRADPKGPPDDVALSCPSGGGSGRPLCWWVWPLPGESEKSDDDLVFVAGGRNRPRGDAYCGRCFSERRPGGSHSLARRSSEPGRGSCRSSPARPAVVTGELADGQDLLPRP